jgi:transcriptional regulator with XRE-family HTH domain
MASIVAKIRDLCADNSTSIRQIEQILGFSKGAIYKWDNNPPSIEKVRMVSEYFHKSIDFMVGRSSIPQLAEECLDDAELITIQRLRASLSDSERSKMMKMLALQFENNFPKD